MNNLILPENVAKIIDTLNKSGFEAFAVGGCIRDMILGRCPDDYDVTTNARPEEIKKVFSHLKTIDTGIKHGTVTVADDVWFTEVTTYRIDGEYKDNRRPENVTFSQNLVDDLSRRDFTINAMAYNADSGLVDCFGGKDDIKNRIIRTVGESKKRFNEDALRILRAIRFSSVLGFELEDKTKKAVHDYAHLLCNISKERILVEFKKLLCADNAFEVLFEYRDIVEIVLPPIKKLSAEEYLVCAKMASEASGDFSFKLSALLYMVSLDEIHFSLKDLKCDNATIDTVCRILSCKSAPKINSSEDALCCLHNYDEYILDNLNLKHIYNTICNIDEDVSLQIENVKSALFAGKAYKISHLDINGNDLIENHIAEGPAIGKVLEEVLMDVIFARVKNDKKEILKHLEK